MSKENIFDTTDKCWLKVPDSSGVFHDIKKVYDSTGKVIWQLMPGTITFRDNIPVTVSYDSNIIFKEIPISQQYMQLVPIGGITVVDNVMSNFSLVNYARTPICIDWTANNSFEIKFKIKTGNNVCSRQELFSMTTTESVELEILNGKFHWEFKDIYGSTSLNLNTTYFLHVIKDKNVFKLLSSTDNLNWKTEINSIACTSVTNEWMHFGIDRVCGNTTTEPFLGTIDINNSMFLYNNISYKMVIDNTACFRLIKGGNLSINDQILSGFEINKQAVNCKYAYSQNYIDWTSSNTFEVMIKIQMPASRQNKAQELLTWRDYDPNNPNAKSTNWLANDFCITSNGYLKWEYDQKTASGTAFGNSSWYYIKLTRNKNIGTLKAFNDKMNEIQSLNITNFPSDRKQYMYVGLDEMSIQRYNYFTNHCVFKGKLDCKESYVVLNGTQLYFRI